jgi:hypothetical protein
MVTPWYPWFTNEMKMDWDVAVEAVSKQPILWNFIPKIFQEDVNFVVEVIKNIPWSSSILKRNVLLRENRKFCLVALLNSDCITYLPKEMMEDREFIIEGVFKFGVRVLENLPDHFKFDMEILWKSKRYHGLIRNIVGCHNLNFYFY